MREPQSQLECAAQRINFPRNWNGARVPTGSIGEESQSPPTTPCDSWGRMNERAQSRDQESRTDLQDCLPRKRPPDDLRFLPPPGGRARGVRAAELRSPSSCRFAGQVVHVAWSAIHTCATGIRARSRANERLTGGPQWQAFRYFWTTCSTCFPGNGTVIFFSRPIGK